MTARLFRLTELHQHISERLRVAERRRATHAFEFTRLALMKARVKALIRRLSARPTLA